MIFFTNAQQQQQQQQQQIYKYIYKSTVGKGKQ